MGRNDCSALELRNKKAQSFQHPNFGAKFVNDAPARAVKLLGPKRAGSGYYLLLREPDAKSLVGSSGLREPGKATLPYNSAGEQHQAFPVDSRKAWPACSASVGGYQTASGAKLTSSTPSRTDSNTPLSLAAPLIVGGAAINGT